jgi:hypothetical protein
MLAHELAQPAFRELETLRNLFGGKNLMALFRQGGGAFLGTCDADQCRDFVLCHICRYYRRHLNFFSVRLGRQEEYRNIILWQL